MLRDGITFHPSWELVAKGGRRSLSHPCRWIDVALRCRLLSGNVQRRSNMLLSHTFSFTSRHVDPLNYLAGLRSYFLLPSISIAIIVVPLLNYLIRSNIFGPLVRVRYSYGLRMTPQSRIVLAKALVPLPGRSEQCRLLRSLQPMP